MSSEDSDEMTDVFDPGKVVPGLTSEEVGPFKFVLPDPSMSASFDGADDQQDVPADPSGGFDPLDPPEPMEANQDMSEGSDPKDVPSKPGGGGLGLTTTGQDESSLDGEGELERAAQLGDEYIDTVEAAMDEEMCDLCEQILHNLRELPLEQQVQGVRELSELKRVAKEDPDPMKIAKLMEDFEVVDDPAQML